MVITEDNNKKNKLYYSYNQNIIGIKIIKENYKYVPMTDYFNAEKTHGIYRAHTHENPIARS